MRARAVFDTHTHSQRTLLTSFAYVFMTRLPKHYIRIANLMLTANALKPNEKPKFFISGHLINIKHLRRRIEEMHDAAISSLHTFLLVDFFARVLAWGLGHGMCQYHNLKAYPLLWTCVLCAVRSCVRRRRFIENRFCESCVCVCLCLFGSR